MVTAASSHRSCYLADSKHSMLAVSIPSSPGCLIKRDGRTETYRHTPKGVWPVQGWLEAGCSWGLQGKKVRENPALPWTWLQGRGGPWCKLFLVWLCIISDAF